MVASKLGLILAVFVAHHATFAIAAQRGDLDEQRDLQGWEDDLAGWDNDGVGANDPHTDHGNEMQPMSWTPKQIPPKRHQFPVTKYEDMGWRPSALRVKKGVFGFGKATLFYPLKQLQVLKDAWKPDNELSVKFTMWPVFDPRTFWYNLPKLLKPYMQSSDDYEEEFQRLYRGNFYEPFGDPKGFLVAVNHRVRAKVGEHQDVRIGKSSDRGSTMIVLDCDVNKHTCILAEDFGREEITFEIDGTNLAVEEDKYSPPISFEIEVYNILLGSRSIYGGSKLEPPSSQVLAKVDLPPLRLKGTFTRHRDEVVGAHGRSE